MRLRKRNNELEFAMADGKSLLILGALLGAITAVVMLVAIALVQAHVDGRLTLDDVDRQTAALSSSALMR
jgi:hypothetical protein